MEDRTARPPKYAGMVFLTGTLALVCFRIILKLDFIDPATGFYQTDGVPERVFNGMYLLFLALLLLTARLDPDDFAHKKLPGLRLVSVPALLLGLCTLARSAWDGYALYRELRAGGLQLGMELLLSLVTLVVSLAAGLVFLSLAANMGCEVMGGYPVTISLVLPVLYQCFLLVGLFTSRTAPLTISDGIYRILAGVLAILFMMAHARVLVRFNLERGYRLLEFAGYAYPMTVLLLLAPQLAGVLTGRLEGMDAAASLSAAGELALALYAFCFTHRAVRAA